MLLENLQLPPVDSDRAPATVIFMQANDARDLRREWKAKGNPPCEHESTSRELDLGSHTGDYVCDRCGAYVDKR